MNQVKVFWGSKKDFNSFLEKENLDDWEMELRLWS